MASDTQTTPYGALSASLNSNRLADLCLADGVQTGPFGSQLHQEDYVEDGTPIITVEHLGENRIVHQDLPRVSEEDKQRLAKYSLRTGDIVFSRVGSVDRRAIVREAENGWLFSGRCLRVRPNPEKLDPLWLSYFFGLSAFKQYIRGIAVGATMPSINTKILSDVPIYFPGLDQQRHTAKLLASLDDKIEINCRINQTLEAIAQAIFKSWFVDFDPVKAKIAAIEQGQDPLRAAMRAISGKTDAELDQMPREHHDQLAATAALFPDAMEESELGEIPEGWKAGKLSDLADFQNGYAFKTKDWSDEGHPVVKIGNVKPGMIDVTGCSFVTSDAVKELGRFALDRGDLLVGMTGYVGETGLVPELKMRAYLNQRVGRLITRKGLDDVGYVYCLVRNQAYKSFAEGKAHGSAQANVSGKDLMGYDAILPAQDLLNEFNGKMAPVLKQILANHEEGLSLAQLRDTLLPKLLSGELSVTETKERVTP